MINKMYAKLVPTYICC